MAGETAVTYFSLGEDTDILPERYANPVIYLGVGGSGTFLVGPEGCAKPLRAGECLSIDVNTLCGVSSADGFVCVEIMPRKEIFMNKAVKAGEVFSLAALVPYEKDSIVNMDVASNDAMKLVVMAFDAGTGLSEHRAPGDALVLALEGEATIGYEGESHRIHAGESFRFEKNGLHSVKAEKSFKMALLMTLK
ncbi:MAG: cupin domain-containing protein [Eubacterium sp.]|nr:cupin domain-containing protein [Eubacterium sp.]